MNLSAKLRLLAGLGLFVANLSAGQDRPPAGSRVPTATAIVEKSQQAFYYPADDMKAKVTMELITDDGKKRTRDQIVASLAPSSTRWPRSTSTP